MENLLLNIETRYWKLVVKCQLTNNIQANQSNLKLETKQPNNQTLKLGTRN